MNKSVNKFLSICFASTFALMPSTSIFACGHGDGNNKRSASDDTFKLQHDGIKVVYEGEIDDDSIGDDIDKETAKYNKEIDELTRQVDELRLNEDKLYDQIIHESKKTTPDCKKCDGLVKEKLDTAMKRVSIQNTMSNVTDQYKERIKEIAFSMPTNKKMKK